MVFLKDKLVFMNIGLRAHALICAILAFDSPVCVYELESLIIVITMRFLIIGTEK